MRSEYNNQSNIKTNPLIILNIGIGINILISKVSFEHRKHRIQILISLTTLFIFEKLHSWILELEFLVGHHVRTPFPVDTAMLGELQFLIGLYVHTCTQHDTDSVTRMPCNCLSPCGYNHPPWRGEISDLHESMIHLLSRIDPSSSSSFYFVSSWLPRYETAYNSRYKPRNSF